MTEEEKQKLVDAWIKCEKSEKGSPKYEENFWAFSKMLDIEIDEPELCWELILKIFAKDRSNKVMEGLSAGSLENLLATHGEDFIERVEEQAKRNPSFATLLGGVWKSHMKEDIWKRVQAVWDRRGWDGIK